MKMGKLRKSGENEQLKVDEGVKHANEHFIETVCRDLNEIHNGGHFCVMRKSLTTFFTLVFRFY